MCKIWYQQNKKLLIKRCNKITCELIKSKRTLKDKFLISLYILYNIMQQLILIAKHIFIDITQITS